MAEISFKIIPTPFDGSGIQLVKWEILQNGDTGVPYPCPAHADKSIQIIGTFGSGGKISIQGSNMKDSPTYAALSDPQGNPLTDITAAKIEQILENTYWIRPSVTAGDGDTDLDVYLLVSTSR